MRQTPWGIQRSVVFTLFVRELRARFGRFRMSYFWAIAEPVALIVILSAVKVVLGDDDIAGLSFPVFFASGITAYLLFSNIVNSSLFAIEANQGLFTYQRVKPFDVIAARALLELMITLGTAAFILPGLYWLGFTFSWNDTLAVFAVMLCLFAFSFGFGLIAGILGPLWQESKKVIPVMIRPFFFISGIFFPAALLPEAVKGPVMLNPLIHAVECLREAMFAGYTSTEGSLFYLFCWATGMLLTGLVVYRIYHVKVLTSGEIR